MRLKSIILSASVCLGLAGFAGCSSPTEADISLLYITDLHGLLLPEDFNDGGMAPVSLANFSSYKKIVTQDDRDRFILLCGGDVNNEQPSIYYYSNYVKFEDHISAQVLNTLGFDAVQMGSNDLYAGAHVNQDLLPYQYKMPYLCANAIDERTGRCAMTPYTIIKRNGVRVAVLGLMDPNNRFGVRESYYEGMYFESIEKTAREWVARIREEEDPDLIVGLFHSSLKGTESVSIEGIDLYLVGFDHQARPVDEFLVDAAGDSVRVVEPLHHCQEVARIDFHFSKVDGKWQHDKGHVERIPLASFLPDEEFCNQFSNASADVDTYLSSQISNYAEAIPASDAFFGPSVIMDMVHNMQLWVTKADISLSNLACTLDGVDSGVFTMRDMFKLYRFDNQLLIEEMTGAEIQKYLEHAVNAQFNTMKNANDHLLAFSYNDDGEVVIGQYGPELKTPHYQFSTAAGIKYVVDVSKPEGHKVRILSMSDGTPFEFDRTYRVVMNDYQAAGGGYHMSHGVGWDLKTAEERCVFQGDIDLRMYFVNYIKLHKDQPVCRNDWKVIPQDWWEKGRKRDEQMLHRMFVAQ